VQAIHAAVEAGRRGLIPAAGAHPHLVLCTVPDAHALALAARSLRVAGVPHAEFREPDLGGQLTAVCTGPLDRPLRRHFRRYPLYDPHPEPSPCSRP
jgi:hypothetical protein